MKDFGYLVIGPQSVNSRVLAPTQMGSAVGVLAGLFSRFRIIKAIFTYVPFQSTQPGQITMGVADDNATEGGSSPVPINALEVLDLRSSTQVPIGEGGELVWTPLDPEKKYYTYTIPFNTTTGADQRDSIPGTFYLFSDGATINVQITLRVIIEFSGQIADATSS